MNPSARPARAATAEQIATFQQDGVVLIRNAISPEIVSDMLSVVEQQLRTPGRWVNDQPEPDTGGRMFTDRYLWRENTAIRNYAFNSGIGALVGQLMNSETARLYFDHLFVKEPGTRAPTPWHQDVPYWPFRGRKIASAWVALSDARIEESALEFVRGSHQDGTIFAPAVFGDPDKSANTNWQVRSNHQPVPDIEANRDDHDIIGWDMHAGDAVIFSAWVLHGAPGNASASQRRMAISTRWLGDDAVWFPHPAADPTVGPDDVSVQPGELANDNDRFPLVWQAEKHS